MIAPTASVQAIIAIGVWLLVFAVIGFTIWMVIDHRRYWRRQGWNPKTKRFERRT